MKKITIIIKDLVGDSANFEKFSSSGCLIDSCDRTIKGRGNAHFENFSKPLSPYLLSSD